MSLRFITLPNGRRCGLATYTAAWRALKALPPSAHVRGFSYFSDPASYILAELRAGLAARINRHLPTYGRGRKWSDDWQRAALQTARAVNTPRLAVRWVPVDLRARLAHRISKED